MEAIRKSNEQADESSLVYLFDSTEQFDVSSVVLVGCSGKFDESSVCQRRQI
jgi:hypothetical protein